MLKNKEDCINWVNDRINKKFEGEIVVLNEITNDFYYWNSGGARILKNENQISFNELINIVYKNRKLINEWYKSI